MIQVYISANWMLLLITLVFLLIFAISNRYLFLKPSMIVITFFHLQIQWSGTIQSEYIYQYLSKPWEFMFILHGFPLLGGALSVFLFRRDSSLILRRITTSIIDANFSVKKIFAPLFFMWGLILTYYLYLVPFQATGLYAVLFDPSRSGIAREESLKMLDSSLLKYSYTFLRSAIAPILGVFTFHELLEQMRNRRLILSLLYFVLLIAVLFSVMLPGDRSAAAFLVLAILFSYFIKKGMPLNIRFITISAFIVLLIPVVMTLIREGKAINAELIIQYLSNSMIDRTFIVPMETGLWHVHYAQTNGYFGIQGIPKLAALYDQISINVPNLIYRNYTAAPLPFGLSNTAYVFSYYSYFGIFSLFLSIILLNILDFVMVIFRYIPTKLIIPAISALFLSCVKLVSSDYTTTLISGGFLVILVVIAMLSVLMKISLEKNQ